MHDDLKDNPDTNWSCTLIPQGKIYFKQQDGQSCLIARLESNF